VRPVAFNAYYRWRKKGGVRPDGASIVYDSRMKGDKKSRIPPQRVRILRAKQVMGEEKGGKVVTFFLPATKGKKEGFCSAEGGKGGRAS